MQALIRSARTSPARLGGHWHRESAALGRGASQQSQVHHISCASVAQRSSHPKHPTARSTASLLVRTATEGPQSTGKNNFSPYNGNKHATLIPSIAKPLQRQTAAVAGHSQLQPSCGRLWQAAADRGRPQPDSSQPQPDRGLPKPAVASTADRSKGTGGHGRPAASRSLPP